MPYHALLWQRSLVVGQIDPLGTSIDKPGNLLNLSPFAEGQNNLLPLF